MKTKQNISELRKAYLFASEAHKGVYRKFSGEEYITHPIAVANIVRKNKKSKQLHMLLTCALLHDVVEDVEGITVETIQKIFGDFVASIVAELTSDPNEIKKLGKAIYLLNKMIHMTSYALVIKLADRLHNCSKFPSEPEKFTTKYVSQTRFIIDGLKSSNRTLSKTHISLIRQIEVAISKYE